VTQPPNRNQDGLQDICVYFDSDDFTGVNGQEIAVFTNDTQQPQPVLVMEANLTTPGLPAGDGTGFLGGPGVLYGTDDYWNVLLRDENGNQAVLPLREPAANGMIHFSNDGLTVPVGALGSVPSLNISENTGNYVSWVEKFQVLTSMQITGIKLPTQAMFTEVFGTAPTGYKGSDMMLSGSFYQCQLWQGTLAEYAGAGGDGFYVGEPVKDIAGNEVFFFNPFGSFAAFPFTPWDGFAGGDIPWDAIGGDQEILRSQNPIDLVPGVDYWITCVDPNPGFVGGIVQALPEGPIDSGLSFWIPADVVNISTDIGGPSRVDTWSAVGTPNFFGGTNWSSKTLGPNFIGPFTASFAFLNGEDSDGGPSVGSHFFALGGALIASPGLVEMSGKLTLQLVTTGTPNVGPGSFNFRALIGAAEPGEGGGTVDGGPGGNITGVHGGQLVKFEETGL
jgi:hypothetical protein